MIDIEKEKIWAIGLFEGEGTILYGGNGKTTNYCQVSLSSTDPDIILRWHKTFGGNIDFRPGGQTGLGSKPIYRVTIGRYPEVIAFLTEAYPYLSQRRKQKADEVLNGPARRCGKRSLAMQERLDAKNQRMIDTLQAMLIQ